MRIHITYYINKHTFVSLCEHTFKPMLYSTRQ